MTEETYSDCPLEIDGCPGFSSTAKMYDLCDYCYEGRWAVGERE